MEAKGNVVVNGYVDHVGATVSFRAQIECVDHGDVTVLLITIAPLNVKKVAVIQLMDEFATKERELRHTLSEVFDVDAQKVRFTLAGSL